MTIHTTATATTVADAELRFLQAGKAICRLRVASNDRKYNRDANQWEDGDATFIDVTVFGAKAEACAEIRKGTLVMIVGKLKSRDWEDKQGQKRTSYEILADEVATVVKAQASGAARPPATLANDPWAAQQPANDPWAASGGSQGSLDDEPPF